MTNTIQDLCSMCLEPAYGHGFCRAHYNHWTPPASDYAELKFIERKDWPQGAKPDGKAYSLEAERAMKPLMVDFTDEFDLDEDGEIQWVPVDENAKEKPTTSGATGTYDMVARLATKLNKIQLNSANGKLGWVYTPALIVPQAVA